MSLAKRIFSREFKIKVCEEVEAKIKTQAEAIREYSLSSSLLSGWLSDYRKNPSNCFTGMGNRSIYPQNSQNTRIKELEAALGRATYENQVLKEANLLLKKSLMERRFTK
jgi:transposase-like protein